MRLFSCLALAALSLSAVACTQSADDSAAASSEINAVDQGVSATPKCAEEPMVEGVSIFRDAHASNVFYALPQVWSIDPIATRTPILADGNGQSWVDAAEKLSPMVAANETSFHLSASTRVPLDTLKSKLASAHPELAAIEVRLLPLQKAGEPSLSVLNVEESDPAQVKITASDVTSLDVSVTHKTLGGLNGFVTFLSKKAAPMVLDVPVSFACTGEVASRTLHLNGSGASFEYPGKGISVTNESDAFTWARSLVNSCEVFLDLADVTHQNYSAKDVQAFHDGIDAALRPVLTAPASALHSSDLTKKAAADATAVINALHAAYPTSDVSTLLERAASLGEYEYRAGTEPFGG